MYLLRLPNSVYYTRIATPLPFITSVTLTNFIQSKKLEGVTQLTLNQLEQRCNDFLGYLKELNTDKPTNSIAMHYRDRLLKRKLSSKTLKDYIAANRQFFNWCLAHELITANPFAVVKTSSKNAKSAQEQRQRWQNEDLQKLFSSDAYRKQNTDFKWITLLMLYQGCRPSEAEKPVIQSNRTHSSNIVRYGLLSLCESSPASKRNTAL